MFNTIIQPFNLSVIVFHSYRHIFILLFAIFPNLAKSSVFRPVGMFYHAFNAFKQWRFLYVCPSRHCRSFHMLTPVFLLLFHLSILMTHKFAPTNIFWPSYKTCWHNGNPCSCLYPTIPSSIKELRTTTFILILKSLYSFQRRANFITTFLSIFAITLLLLSCFCFPSSFV